MLRISTKTGSKVQSGRNQIFIGTRYDVTIWAALVVRINTGFLDHHWLLRTTLVAREVETGYDVKVHAVKQPTEHSWKYIKRTRTI